MIMRSEIRKTNYFLLSPNRRQFRIKIVVTLSEYKFVGYLNTKHLYPIIRRFAERKAGWNSEAGCDQY